MPIAAANTEQALAISIRWHESVGVETIVLSGVVFLQQNFPVPVHVFNAGAIEPSVNVLHEGVMSMLEQKPVRLVVMECVPFSWRSWARAP